jgi:prepilin-type N-terminal cleavage/methylation domain-containing protein
MVRTLLRRRRRDEAGVSLVEMMIALVLFSVVVVAVDSSLTVVQDRQVQVVNTTEALDYLQVAQQAIATDLRAAQTWTTPAVPTSAPSGPTTAQSLVFTASLNEVTNLITITLNTTTHQLVVCANLTLTTSGCGSGVSGVKLQALVNNIDSSSLFTLTTSEVSQTINSVTTHTWFYTTGADTLTLDSPSVTAAHVTKTTLTLPTIVMYNAVFSCQTASGAEGASGTC